MRYTVALFIVISLFLISVQSAYAVYILSAEYRQDAIDFGSDKKSYYRSIAGIKTDSTEAYATFVRTGRGDSTVTWAFMAMSNYASITGGHYFVHNGTGLLLGKPSVYNPDPYAIHTNKHDVSLTLCKSGNPQYPMYGMVVSLYEKPKNNTITIHSGVSLKECFIRLEDAKEGVYPYSIHSLLSHYTREDMYTEPVHLITYFTNVLVKPFDNVIVQGSYFTSHISYNNDHLLFNANPQDGSALQTFGGYSIYARYQDKIISLYTEHAISKVHIANNGEIHDAFRRAYCYGFTLKKKSLVMNSYIQKSDSEFYAPFSNSFGGYSPRDIYYYSVKIIPAQWFTIAVSYSDQNNLLPSTYYKEFPHKRIHNVRLTFKKNTISLQSDYRYALVYKDGKEDTASRYQQGVVVAFTKHFSLHGKCGVYKGNDTAWYTASGLRLRMGGFSSDTGFIYAHTKGEKMYMAMLPLQNSSIASETIDQTKYFLVARVSYKNALCLFTVRLLSELSGTTQTGEIFATVKF